MTFDGGNQCQVRFQKNGELVQHNLVGVIEIEKVRVEIDLGITGNVFPCRQEEFRDRRTPVGSG